MSKKLEDIARQLNDANKKVQLIYAFNGSGKTRLSRVFKDLVAPKKNEGDNDDEAELSRNKVLYYSAFTEDLFYWDNDLEADSEPKLKIQPNTFTDWLISLLKELGEDGILLRTFSDIRVAMLILSSMRNTRRKPRTLMGKRWTLPFQPSWK